LPHHVFAGEIVAALFQHLHERFRKSQAHAGWKQLRSRYDDGGFSGGSTDRPALQQLLADIQAGKIDVIVVYEVDRLTRSLADFAKLVELFDKHGVSFVSVTQQFNTTTSMGRLTLNVLLSFAQFEREVTSERIRDKIAASKRKGLWVGGVVPLGYRLEDHKIKIEESEAKVIRHIFKRYLDLSVTGTPAGICAYQFRTGSPGALSSGGCGLANPIVPGCALLLTCFSPSIVVMKAASIATLSTIAKMTMTAARACRSAASFFMTSPPWRKENDARRLGLPTQALGAGT